CSGASILVLSSLALWGQVQPSYAQVLPVRAASGHVAPLPIPGADLIPCPCTGQAGGSLLIHQFLPGPGFDGQDAEPNGITNFNGPCAQVYMGGHAGDSAATSVPRQTMKEVPYGKWREYEPADTVRFYVLRLYEDGWIKSTPQKILAQGTDWRFFNEFKKELKG